MAKFTRTAIKYSFMKLLNEMPFDKITIKDIVDDCGINRNTFYYNFRDIYALVDEILQDEINKIVKEHKTPYISWQDGISSVIDFARKNRKAIYHLHNSVKKNQVEKYLEHIIYDVVFEFVSLEAKKISDENIMFISHFYTYALLGMLNKWLDDGMTEDLDEVIRKIAVLLDNNINNNLSAIDK